MLKSVLAEIAKGKESDMRRLAKRLGVSNTLVRQMVKTLEKTGYLHSASPTCIPVCNQCPIRQKCSAIWVLTPKTRQMLKETKK